MATKPIRVLQVIGAMDRGGAETLIMNLYRHIDRNAIQFDFLVNDSNPCDYDEEILELGGKIHVIPRYNIANFFSYRKACRAFFRSHQYPVVHGHIGLPAPIYLMEARKTGAFLIAHSHAQKSPLTARELAFRLSTYPTRYCADYYLGCSEKAGLDLFGAQVVNSNRFHVLMNGIDISAAQFSETARLAIRKELGINLNAAVYGHVGRLTHIKNQTFLLQVFANLVTKQPDAHLILVGRGEDEDLLKKKVRELKLNNCVHFLGVRKDVPEILSAIDVFIFPSYKEGLANAAIEAQASGASCILSSGVPELACISSDTIHESLESGAERWAELALSQYSLPRMNRQQAVKFAHEAGFDIIDSAHWVSNFYQNHAHWA